MILHAFAANGHRLCQPRPDSGELEYIIWAGNHTKHSRISERDN